MKIRRNIIIYTIIAMFVILVGMNYKAFADEADTEAETANNAIEIQDAPSTNSLQISPVSMRIPLEAGKIVEKIFSVHNTAAQNLGIKIYVTPYSMNGVGKEADFETETNHTQLSHWITFLNEANEPLEDPEYILKPDQSINIKYRISVPDDVPSGGQYATLFAESIDEQSEEEGVHTITRAGMIIYATVAGETRQEVKINNVNLNTSLFGGNISISADVENTGNIDFQTSIDLNIKSVFGKTLYSDRFIYTVLPDSTRKVYTEWLDTPFYGIFHLSYTIDALGTTVDAKRYVLVMPPVILALTIVIVSAVAITMTAYIRKKMQIKKEKESEIKV